MIPTETPMAKTRAKAKGLHASPDAVGKMVTFRLPPQTVALIESLAASYTDDPDMPATKTGVVVIAIRELAERRLKAKK
jgi:hypothetical protein